MFGGAINKRGSSRKCPIGIDVGSHTVRAMQLERYPDGALRATAASSVKLRGNAAIGSDDYHQAVGEAVAKAIAAGGFAGKRVVSTLPAAAVQYKNLRLPKMPIHELQAAVEWEASDRMQLAAEPYSIQYFDAGEVRQGEEIRQEVIMLACATSFVEKHVASLLDAGLFPCVVDVVPAALARCVLTSEATTRASDASIATIDVGYASSKVLITRGDSVLFFKLIDIGGKHFDQAVAKHLGLPEPEVSELRRRMARDSGESEGEASKEHMRRAIHESIRPLVGELGREIGLCLRYYSVTFRGKRPEHAELIGGESTQAWLPKMLGESAGVAVLAANPLSGIDLAAVQSVHTDGSAAAWAVAAGLSMRQESRRLVRVETSGVQGAAA